MRVKFTVDDLVGGPHDQIQFFFCQELRLKLMIRYRGRFFQYQMGSGPWEMPSDSDRGDLE